jgi:ribosome maturation factor RimP
MITKEAVVKVLEEILAGSDKFLVDVVLQHSNRMTIYIDGDRNITIRDCQEITRAIEDRFDRDQEDFDLTVSSYGIDRPLKLPRQFVKNIGRELELVLVDGKATGGILVNAGNDAIELEHPVRNVKKEVKRENSMIPFSEIKTAKIIVKFDK